MSSPGRRRFKNDKWNLLAFVLLALSFEARCTADTFSAPQSPLSEDEPGLPTLHRRRRRRRHRRTLQRLLEVGDFDAVNEVWGNVTVPFPDQVIVESVAGTDVVVNLTGLTCTGWNVGDVQLVYFSDDDTAATTTTTIVQFEVVAVDVQCQTRYSYDSRVSSGGGGAFLVTQDNLVRLDFSLRQPDGAEVNVSTSSGVTVTLDGCDSDVNIKELEMEPAGGGDGFGTSVLERLLRAVLKRQIRAALCERAADVEAALQDGFDQVEESLPAGTEDHGNASSPFFDPLVAEAMLNPLTDWLDFKNPESSMENAVSQILFEQPDLWIGVLWELLLVQDGLDLNLQVQDFVFPTVLANVTLRVQSARIQAVEGGSPTLSDLSAIGFATLSLEALLPALSVEIGVEVQIQADTQTFVDTAQIRIPLIDVEVAMLALVAVDEGRLGNLTVGSVLLERWDCFFSALQRLRVHEFKLQFETDELTVSGLTSSPGLRRLLQDAVALGFDLYGSVLNKNLARWIQGTVLNLDESLLDSSASGSGHCPDFGDDRIAFIDFRDLLLRPQESVKLGGSGTMPYGSLLPSLKSFVSDLLADESSVSSFVDLAIASDNESVVGSSKLMIWTQPLVDQSNFVRIGKQRIVAKMKVDQLTLENAVSFSHPRVLDPIRSDQFTLNNSVVLAASQPLRVSARIFVRLDLLYDGMDAIENEFILGVELQSLQLAVRTFAKVYADRVMNFPLKNVLNWRCWMATVQAPNLDSEGFRDAASKSTMSIPEVDVVPRQMSFFLNCLNCTGRKFDDLSELLDASPTDALARESALNVVDYLISLVEGDSSTLQLAIDRMLVEAPKHCPHCDEYNPYATPTEYTSVASSDSMPTSLVVMVVLLVVVAALVIAGEIWSTTTHQRNSLRWLASLSESERREFQEFHDIRVKEERAWNEASESLLRRQEVSRWVRWIVPFVIVGNCALFLSGHISPGGEVRAYLYFGGEEIVFRDLYAFSIAQICLELWNVGSRGVSVILVIFAIVWPYVKQLITLFLWVVPPRIVTMRRRGSVLRWLDVLAKWSMLDVFVVILSVPAFHIEISSPDKGFLPPNFYRLELAVIPLWGFYANLLAQILSQTTSHVLLHYHRLAACQKAPQIESVVSATTESDSDDREAPPMETPSSPSYDVPPVGTTSRKRVAIASIVAGLTVVLTVLGCILPSYSFDYRGLVGVAIESGMDFGEALKSFSVISTAQNLMDQARSLGSSADVFGMLLFASVLVMTVLVVPVALVGCLLTDRLASGGMRPTGANRLGVAIEILQAWQYTEVYLLSVVLAVWQFSDVSTILCDGLSGLFSMLVSSGVLDPSDAQCFQAQASLQAASYLLLGASIFLYLLSKLTKREEEAGVGIGDR